MQNLPDIAGANAVVPIVLSTSARWVRFMATGASGICRIGGASVSSTVGEPLTATAAGAALTFPQLDTYSRYQPREFFAYIPSGATLSVSYKEG